MTVSIVRGETFLDAAGVADWACVDPNHVFQFENRGQLPMHTFDESGNCAWRMSDLRHFEQRGLLPPAGWIASRAERRPR